MPQSRGENLKDIMYFHHMTYMATSIPRTPAPGVLKFTVLVDPSFAINTL